MEEIDCRICIFPLISQFLVLVFFSPLNVSLKILVVHNEAMAHELWPQADPHRGQSGHKSPLKFENLIYCLYFFNFDLHLSPAQLSISQSISHLSLPIIPIFLYLSPLENLTMSAGRLPLLAQRFRYAIGYDNVKSWH